MDILIQIILFLLSLSILVLVHEFGHFLAARIFHTRVEKFYLFFNPWFHLFRFNYKGTEYGIGWLPLGGYVKIAGMIDESLDKEQLKEPPKPYEFRAKPAWQRLIITLGGVIVNILLAIVIYILMLYVWGEQYLPNSEVKYGITVDSLAYEMGLRDGDFILSIDNEPVEEFYKIPSTIIIEKAKSIQVLRNGEKLDIEIPPGFLNRLIHHRRSDFIGIRFPFYVSDFTKNSPAQKAGLLKGDHIIALNDQPVHYFHEFKSMIRDFKGQEVILTVVRGKDTLAFPVETTPEGIIGVIPETSSLFKLKEHKYSLIEAIPAGTIKAFDGVASYLKQLRLIFSKEVRGYESVGGFITIGSIFPSTWDWQAFWSLTAFLSIMLAILNVLPIPALDGGHVMFILYEIVTRRKPNEKVMEIAQIAGMIIIFGLLIFANGNDIIRWLSNK